MIPNHAPNSLTTSGETVASFGVSAGDEAHVLGILRDQVYSDKVLAVVREYSTNAWDANRSVGRGETPIRVHLPTEHEPYFGVADCGPGLSPEAVATIFTKYGASTKRGDDNQVGMLGIGSKSAFCYATQFTVTSCHGGERRVYTCALDESDIGVVTLLSVQLVLSPDTGVEVRVAVDPDDVGEFRAKALDLYQHFHPTPDCGGAESGVPTAPEDRIAVTGDGGRLVAWVDHGDSCTAVMGCVAYDVDLDQLTLPEDLEWSSKAALTLHFPIGAVQFSADREKLRYTQKTKDALLAALADTTDHLVSRVLEEVEAGEISAFAKRLKLRQLNRLDLPLPVEYEDLAKGWIQLFDKYDPAVPFSLVHNGSSVGRVDVEPELRFLIQDQPNKLTGYHLGDWDYVVCPSAKTKVAAETARAALLAHLAACGLAGVPVADLSTVPWATPTRSHRRGAALPGARAKYKAAMLVLEADPALWGLGAMSSRWEATTRAPDAADVYVELDKYKSRGTARTCTSQPRQCDFYDAYEAAAKLLALLGEATPAVYGYKEGKGALPRAGVTFYDWYEAKLKEVLARPDVRDALFAHEAKHCLPALPSDCVAALREALGDAHPLVAPYVQAQVPVPEYASKLYPLSGFQISAAPARKWLDHAVKQYPLLEDARKLAYWRSLPDWVDYVRLVDERAARRACGAVVVDAVSRFDVPDVFAELFPLDTVSASS